jgi:DNA-binding XRE family transcriptional regulator
MPNLLGKIFSMISNPFYPLKMARRKAGLSQTELARRAGLSLATIQNIEAGRANPAWSTVESLAGILHLQLSLQGRKPSLVSPVNINELAVLGCPILTPPLARSARLRPSRQQLIEVLERNLDQYIRSARGRDREALGAWLVAIRDHYPSLFLHCPPEVKNHLSRHGFSSVKLRRLALSRLGTFL